MTNIYDRPGTIQRSVAQQKYIADMLQIVHGMPDPTALDCSGPEDLEVDYHMNANKTYTQNKKLLSGNNYVAMMDKELAQNRLNCLKASFTFPHSRDNKILFFGLFLGICLSRCITHAPFVTLFTLCSTLILWNLCQECSKTSYVVAFGIGLASFLFCWKIKRPWRFLL